jgi:hypothetical protein
VIGVSNEGGVLQSGWSGRSAHFYSRVLLRGGTTLCEVILLGVEASN